MSITNNTTVASLTLTTTNTTKLASLLTNRSTTTNDDLIDSDATTIDANIFGICMYMLPALFHLFGLYFVYNTRLNIRNKVQWVYIVNMSVCELCYSLTLILSYSLNLANYPNISRYTTIFSYSALAFWLFTSNLLIVVDRYMEVYLNIRYSLYWSERKASFLVLLTTLLSFIIGIIFSFYMEYLGSAVCYVWLCLGHIHLVVALSSYGYLYNKLKESRKRINTLTSQVLHNHALRLPVSGDSSQPTPPSTTTTITVKPYMERIKKAFFLPTFFILNFIFFTYTPDMVLCFSGSYLNTVNMVTYIMYVLGFLIDALIYVFLSRPIRRTLQKKLNFCNNGIQPWE